GKVRETGQPGDVVWIRGKTPQIEDSLYNPVSARHVERCLKEIIEWYSDAKFVQLGDAGMGMPLVARMAIGHAHFEAIHPFSDGNGRVGRMLFTLQMACSGKLPIYLSGYIEEQKGEYGEVLQEAQKKLNYAPVVEFFAKAIIASNREALVTRKEIQLLPSTWKARGRFRKNSTAEHALSWLTANPIFTVKQLRNQFSVSAQAANTAVDFLRKHAIVRERTSSERNRVFAAEEVIYLLSRRFGTDPKEALLGAQKIMHTSNDTH
ncbi:MAG: Fic family protein, partial [Oligoflexia bacterium]|nr:Fic family protein [Oligoflexia bacterium]